MELYPSKVEGPQKHPGYSTETLEKLQFKSRAGGGGVKMAE